MTKLPVQEYLPQIIAELQSTGSLVISASPGAGKTTLIPPALLEHFTGKIYLLEPRRIAARSAAQRIAAQLNENLGERIGYVVRGDQKVSNQSMLIAMTPGIFLRKLQNDPTLEGVEVVIFDEFHERSLENDLDFSLTLEVHKEIRPDLKLIIMSATLPALDMTSILNASVIEIPGRQFPVEILWSDTTISPLNSTSTVTRAVIDAWGKYPGDILTFLPGVREIDEVANTLKNFLPANALICKLHGKLDLKHQNFALLPTPTGKRKIVLSTNIAESSLTVEGIKIVIDSGLERRLRHLPGRGMSFLEVSRISQASAQQRAGRSGRTAPGVVIRLWDKRFHQQLPEFTNPEILEADLSSIALELAAWRTVPEKLRWLTSPPCPSYQTAVELLKKLELLNQNNQLTVLGRQAVLLPIHPRLSAMLLRAKKYNLAPLGAEIASLLEEKDNFNNFSTVDIRQRIENMRRYPESYRLQLHIRNQILRILKCQYQETSTRHAGLIIAFAYPEWVGRSRMQYGGIYHLSGGSGAKLPDHDELSSEEFIAVARLDGNHGHNNATIRIAAPITLNELKEHFASLFHIYTRCKFDPDSEKVTSWEEVCLINLAISKTPVTPPPLTAGLAVFNEALRRHLLLPPASDQKACCLLSRIRFAAKNDPDKFPNWSSEMWPTVLGDLITPYLSEVKNFTTLRKLPFLSILTSAIGFSLKSELDRLYPEYFLAPTGVRHKVDYSSEIPTLAIRVQELYGVYVHPTIGTNKLPLRLKLLSPALRPIQITSDLPGFWGGSWKRVRADMRSRYPKHSWPEHP